MNYAKPQPGETCQEASIHSVLCYVPCRMPAEFFVKNRDPKVYAMCFGCANHNVRNRGARYVEEGETFEQSKLDRKDEHLYPADFTGIR